ncbi:hypothetical protein [Staphylococcus debuckii]|uniref:hypothetical protein n=1 Tax=Staphylococcus debuckii TaxID=2044912 RepID=UPI000F432332|nr:hypothetical protein [Staphylococcus debuckii]AYU54653.1 hypothetical protein CNQ82_04110 [Staphylococcus debuckii]
MITNDIPLYFSPQLAKEIGLKEAILYEYIKICISTENKNGWTRLPYYQIQNRLTFMSEKSITRCVNNLCNQKLICKGQFGVTGLNRSNWYALRENTTERA